MAHKGIHSRGYLPHWDFVNSLQGITFRLADAVPAKVVEDWREELQVLLTSSDPEISGKAYADLHGKIAKYEDAGHGSCLLVDPEYAGIVQWSLLGGHGTAYKLIEWCVMPNHVHVLIRLLDSAALGSIVKRWKAGTALQINRLLERSGSFWMRDYHDRLIRDLDHLHHAKAYIRNNPVKAGLCLAPEEWRFSSAGFNWDPEVMP
jgi:REP element-mobilizing transposase RayT